MTPFSYTVIFIFSVITSLVMDGISVIILASGLSKRMGRNKLTIKVAGKEIIIHTLEKFVEISRDITVITRPDERIVELLALKVRRIAINSLPEKGMSRSIKIGLKCLPRETKAFFLALGDQPFLKRETLKKIVDVYKEEKCRIVVPVYKGIRGNPVLFDVSMKKKLYSSLKGDKGARNIIMKNLDETIFVEIDDPGISIDLDTPEDLERAYSFFKKKKNLEQA